MLRLELMKIDGTKNYIELVDKITGKDIIDEHILLFENYYYQITIQTDKVFENIELYIGDYAVPLTFNDFSGCYQSSKALLFEGCYDLIDITLCVTDSFQNENTLKSPYLRVATTKETVEQIYNMLEEIESKLPNFLEICFSKSKKKSGLLHDKHRSIFNTFKILEEIIDTYEHNYANFCNFKKNKIIEKPVIVDSNSMRKINDDSLRWMVSNPEYLVPSNHDQGISIGRKKYLPLKIRTFTKEYSYEIYENQTILGFLDSLVSYTQSQLNEFENEIKRISTISKEIIKQLPNTHELTGRCVLVFYRGIIHKLEQNHKILEELYHKYFILFKCTPLIINDIPKSTNIFRKIRHYKLCYECIAKWFEMGNYSLEHLDYLFKLKTLSRIFEYFCLLKLQYAIEKNEYIFQSADRVGEIDELNDEHSINNIYKFSNGKYNLKLLYEPIIFKQKLYSDLNLYSTGYNFSKRCWNDYWTPDFIIELECNDRRYYMILDAKYSTLKNVRQYYIPELILKYGTQIASKDKYYSDVIAIGAIYPNDGNKIFYYKKESNISNRKSLPIYFSMAIEKGDNGDTALSNHLNKLISNVNMLENNLTKTYEESHKNINEDNEELFKGFKDQIDNTIQNIKVNGKYCQYYGKGICLVQKKACYVKSEICADYIHKDDSSLRRKKINCKNLNSSGKNYSCTVSGRKGCIGINECKFYRERKTTI